MLSRPTKTVLALLAISSFTSAGWFDDRLNAIAQRQETNASDTTVTTPIVTPPTETESTTPSAPPSVSTTPTPTPTPTQSTTTIPPTSSTPTPTPTVPSTPTPTPTASSTESRDTTTSTPATKKETTASTTFAPVTKIASVTVTLTRDNGEVVTQTSESTAVMTPTSAAEAKLAADGSGSKDGDGMSSKTKTTIIGVVVGIGGAILLAGLAVVAWRIWGRKKHGDEGDDLMEYNRPDTVEKTGSSGGSSNPFQSTLENYHNPAKQVNASSNF